MSCDAMSLGKIAAVVSCNRQFDAVDGGETPGGPGRGLDVRVGDIELSITSSSAQNRFASSVFFPHYAQCRGRCEPRFLLEDWLTVEAFSAVVFRRAWFEACAQGAKSEFGSRGSRSACRTGCRGRTVDDNFVFAARKKNG